MKHLKRFLILVPICFIFIVILQCVGFNVGGKTFSLLESLEDPWTYFLSLGIALLTTIGAGNWPL